MRSEIRPLECRPNTSGSSSTGNVSVTGGEREKPVGGEDEGKEDGETDLTRRKAKKPSSGTKRYNTNSDREFHKQKSRYSNRKTHGFALADDAPR